MSFLEASGEGNIAEARIESARTVVIAGGWRNRTRGLLIGSASSALGSIVDVMRGRTVQSRITRRDEARGGPKRRRSFPHWRARARGAACLERRLPPASDVTGTWGSVLFSTYSFSNYFATRSAPPFTFVRLCSLCNVESPLLLSTLSKYAKAYTCTRFWEKFRTQLATVVLKIVSLWVNVIVWRCQRSWQFCRLGSTKVRPDLLPYLLALLFMM